MTDAPDRATTIAGAARRASRVLATVPTEAKNRLLLDLAAALEGGATNIATANAEDVAAARAAGLSEAKLRRLTLSAAAMGQMIDGLRQVARLPDPVGEVTRDERVASGLHVRKIRCPLGVILMIYEARPNVTIDAFALCFKAGNACLLKGGREAARTNAALLSAIHAALDRSGLPRDVVALIDADRDALRRLLTLSDLIDLVIPRGGVELIRFVHEHSRIPMVQHFMGVCHIFVDASADLDRAIDLCATAKTSAPSACNAVETLLVHRAVAERFIPPLVERLTRDHVRVLGDAEVRRLAPRAEPAAPEDFGREFLDLVVAVRVVADLDAALAHIATHGSNHTESILSADPATQQRFCREVEASCVLVNASTRFNDGYQLGLGAEIGISTSRVHAYGPMGLAELTSQRYLVEGDYQTR